MFGRENGFTLFSLFLDTDLCDGVSERKYIIVPILGRSLSSEHLLLHTETTLRDRTVAHSHEMGHIGRRNLKLDEHADVIFRIGKGVKGIKTSFEIGK